jgi:hypothetical protein
MFHDAALEPGKGARYRVCWRQGARKGCATRTILGSAWDTWRMKMGASTKRIAFTWTVGGKTVGKRSVRVRQ